jgi:hypothetical protein
MSADVLRMRARLWIVAIAAIMLYGCASRPLSPIHPDWQLYHNSKYRYQIEYPNGYDLWETGLEGERDGSSIRIGLHEYEAVTPALDAHVGPQAAAHRFPALIVQPPDLTVQTGSILLNGLPAKETQLRWKPSGDLAFVDIEMEGVLFEFMASSGTLDFYRTDWWAIIQTFRFTG